MNEKRCGIRYRQTKQKEKNSRIIIQNKIKKEEGRQRGLAIEASKLL